MEYQIFGIRSSCEIKKNAINLNNYEVRPPKVFFHDIGQALLKKIFKQSFHYFLLIVLIIVSSFMYYT